MVTKEIPPTALLAMRKTEVSARKVPGETRCDTTCKAKSNYQAPDLLETAVAAVRCCRNAQQS